MTLPSWTIKLAAAAVIPVVVGMGAAFSATSPLITADTEFDADYRPGMDGVDFAAVTGPVVSQLDQGRSCEDPSWPRVPAGCVDVVIDRD